MLKCIDIDIPTGLIYQITDSLTNFGAAWGMQMEHIKIHDDLIRICDDVFRTIFIDDIDCPLIRSVLNVILADLGHRFWSENKMV